ncbi:Transcription elongation factor spt6 [Batrachochytrium dendrobatidis]
MYSNEDDDDDSLHSDSKHDTAVADTDGSSRKKRQQISDSDDDEGEDISRPFGSRPEIYSDDDEDDEDEDDEEGEMTEADKKFIASDDEDADAEEGSDSDRAKRRRRHRRKRARKERQAVEARVVEGDEALSDDELDLIKENMGDTSFNFKRLRKKADEFKNNVDYIFDDDEDIATSMGTETVSTRKRGDDGFRDEDDLADFIIEDDDLDGPEEPDEVRQEKIRRRRERQEFAKNIGTGYGISDESWNDIQELFGDGGDYAYALHPDEIEHDEGEEDDEFLMESQQRKLKNVRLSDVYEPSEIASKMLTEDDDRIRNRDIPERYQLLDQVSTLDDAELASEATFITRLLVKERQNSQTPVTNEALLLSAVTHLVRFIRRDLFEVPFIYMYRKDYFDGILDLPDLWRIVDLNTQFLGIESKKRAVLSLINDILKIDDRINSDIYIRTFVDRLNSFDDVQDAINYLQLTYCIELDAHQNTLQKRRLFKRVAWRRDYEDAKKNNIGGLVNLFNVNIQQYSASMTTQQSLHLPEDHHESPLVAASQFVSPRFPDPESALAAARLVIGQDIAAYPQLRAFIRRVYFVDAVIDVLPTERGKREIVPHHPYYHFKYLKEKPKFSFTDGQFLQIMTAESEGLVVVSVRVEEEPRLLADIMKYICNDYVNDLAEEWNTQRRMIAEYAAKQVIFPLCSKWLKEQLLVSAIEWTALKCQEKLERWVSMSPYRPAQSSDDVHSYDDVAPVVLSITWGEGDRSSPTFAAIIGENGQLSEYLKLDKLNDRERGNDLNMLIDLAARFRPAVVVVGGLKPNTQTQLLRLLEETITAAEVQGKLKENIPVMIVEDEVARIYMHSKRAELEFPIKDYPQLIRYCVSLGRRVQDPTQEFAGLFNVNEDYKSLRIHPLQNLLPDLKRKTVLERALMNAVSLCGVDINAAASNSNLAHTLQFVSGLGPRKSQAIISKIIRSGGKLESRADLIRKNLCAAKVFINCASFLRIRSKHFRQSFSDSVIDVLDDTRVHPEDYDLARKMAADALDLDDTALDEDDTPSQHVAELMESGDADRLNQLLLDDYAIELERRIHQPKLICLNEIRKELIHPYQERRQQFQPASYDEIFSMLTGESDDTLYEGLITSGHIVIIKDRFLFCRLSSGLEGMVHAKNLDIPHGHQSLTELFQINMSIPVCVVGVNKERMTVELSGRVESNATMDEGNIKRDQYFNAAQEHDDIAASKAIKYLAKPKKQVRVIQHPFFKNMDYRAAEEYLSTRPRGEVVVRPSTRGNDHISITWKVDDGLYQHVDVLELEKENEWALGKVLRIDKQAFTEIDQIIAEYIEPMTRRIAQVMNHDKFKRKSLDDMFVYVSEQMAVLKRSAYGFIVVPHKPGMFYLVFRHPQNRPHHDYVIVQPDGLLFRKVKFQSIDDLLAYFKKTEAERSTSVKSRGVAPSTHHLATGVGMHMNPQRQQQYQQQQQQQQQPYQKQHVSSRQPPVGGSRSSKPNPNMTSLSNIRSVPIQHGTGQHVDSRGPSWGDQYTGNSGTLNGGYRGQSSSNGREPRQESSWGEPDGMARGPPLKPHWDQRQDDFHGAQRGGKSDQFQKGSSRDFRGSQPYGNSRSAPQEPSWGGVHDVHNERLGGTSGTSKLNSKDLSWGEPDDTVRRPPPSSSWNETQDPSQENRKIIPQGDTWGEYAPQQTQHTDGW